MSCYELWSGRLRAPAHLAFAPGQPMPAFFREVFPLAELLGLQLAAEQGSAMGVGSVGEVLAGDADPSRSGGSQQLGLHEFPFIHALGA